MNDEELALWTEIQLWRETSEKYRERVTELRKALGNKCTHPAITLHHYKFPIGGGDGWPAAEWRDAQRCGLCERTNQWGYWQ